MPRYDKEALEDRCRFFYDGWAIALPSKPEELLLHKIAVFLPAVAERGTCCSGLFIVGVQEGTRGFLENERVTGLIGSKWSAQ